MRCRARSRALRLTEPGFGSSVLRLWRSSWVASAAPLFSREEECRDCKTKYKDCHANRNQHIPHAQHQSRMCCAGLVYGFRSLRLQWRRGTPIHNHSSSSEVVSLKKRSCTQNRHVSLFYKLKLLFHTASEERGRKRKLQSRGGYTKTLPWFAHGRLGNLPWRHPRSFASASGHQVGGSANGSGPKRTPKTGEAAHTYATKSHPKSVIVITDPCD